MNNDFHDSALFSLLDIRNGSGWWEQWRGVPLRRNDDPCPRNERLVDLARLVGELPDGLIAVHDHKGSLSVFWAYPPTPPNRRRVELAWTLLSEDGNSAEHSWGDYSAWPDCRCDILGTWRSGTAGR